MRDDLDRLIDGALSVYSSAEPLAGLEERVLNRVRVRQAARRRWWWAALPGTAAAVLLVVVLIPRPRTIPMASVSPAPAEVKMSPAPTPAAPPLQTATRRNMRTHRPLSPRALPKEELFPTPAPLTPEERLLSEVATSHPEALLIRPVDEIEIKPIEIAPLDIGGED